MKKIIVFILLLSSAQAFADEGMWLPQLLGKLNESRMKTLGMKMSAADIYSVNSGSLKDAVVSFGGFCTGDIISREGLVLTNHHCGFDAIQNHSSVQNNYLRDGFWSKTPAEELTNKGLFVTFIIRIDDVTGEVMRGITPQMNAKERQSVIDKNMIAANTKAKKEFTQQSFVRGFFEANQYYLFVTETFRDIRLVGAPPSSIGNFGKDTDNWVWPRHTGDFSLFRIYAGKDNKPADYSADNVPYKPKKSLKISLDGVAENDFTLIFGFPGRTQEYLPGIAVEQIRTVNDPIKISIRNQALQAIDSYMRKDEAIKIKYASKYAGIQNAYKKWQGEVLGLSRTNAYAKKMDYEKLFSSRVAANAAWKTQYGNLLPRMNELYEKNVTYSRARDVHNEVFSKIELYKIAMQLQALVGAFENGGANAYDARLAKAKPAVEDILHEYETEVDRAVFAGLMNIYLKDQPVKFVDPMMSSVFKEANGSYMNAVNDFYDKNNFDDSAVLRSIFLLNPAQAVSKIKSFPAMSVFESAQNSYRDEIQPSYNVNQDAIDSLQRIYMKAQMEVMKEKKFYPDANSTMRVGFGKVQGYTARDAVSYDYQTDLEGAMQKYVPGDYEFDLPEKLRALYAAKDYGPYANKNGQMPVCFIATNHSTGGNSGSPVLDAYGNLIGLNFDRVWEGTMSDINYDPTICRNIMVDIRYVLFVIDKFAGAERLIKEMDLVHPKKK